jgi:hypothetical protein
MATPRFKPFMPYGVAPAGTYDPSIDQQVAAGQRGLVDLGQDSVLGARRATEDYGFGVSDLNLSQSRGTQDIGTQRDAVNRSFDRSTTDIGTQRGYATEDHQRAIDALTRGYSRLGNQQGQQARVMGVGGGALVQAARKRAENMAFDQAPIDTGFNRQIAGLDTSQQRLGEDRSTALSGLDTAQGRLTEDTSRGTARLGVNLQRQIDPDTGDLSRPLQRAGREQNQLETFDAPQSRFAQAVAGGWDPGPRPSNESVGGPFGDHKVIQRGGFDYIVDPHGKVLSKHRRV